MKKIQSVILFAVVMIGSAPLQSDNFTLTGGNPVLTVSTGTIASGLASATNSTTMMTYKQIANKSKITVQTTCSNQKFNLTVEPTFVTSGSSSGVITLTNGMAAADFIVNIGKGSGTAYAWITYTATATFEQGNSTESGSDSHKIIFTQSAF